MGQQIELQHVIVLRGCRNAARMQVGGGWLMGWFTVWLRGLVLNEIVRRSGLTFFGGLGCRYSSDPSHGYTYLAAIGQSGIMIHIYPEVGTVTVYLVTCPEEDDDGSAARKFERMLRLYFCPTSFESRPDGHVVL